jgi:hypothetical protein
MPTFNLIFSDRPYSVPKASIRDFFEHHVKNYEVRSSVPISHFERFVASLNTQTTISLTTDNVVSVSLLAREFALSGLLSECTAFSRSRDVESQLEIQKREFASIRSEMEKVKRSIRESADLRPGQRQAAVHGPTAVPLRRWRSLNGIIAYLTKKHGGNVHEKGIVTITSRSVANGDPERDSAPKHVADLATDSGFWSGEDWLEWVCWDFHEMRVALTYYTIRSLWLRSWGLEGSLDGEEWKWLAYKDDSREFDDRRRPCVSFPCCEPEDEPQPFRFIKLSKQGSDVRGGPRLCLYAVEFFGTLFE